MASKADIIRATVAGPWEKDVIVVAWADGRKQKFVALTDGLIALDVARKWRREGFNVRAFHLGNCFHEHLSHGDPEPEVVL
jgi:hypothetical protein